MNELRPLASLFDLIGGILNTVWAVLCTLIYSLISWFFKVFIKISELDILSTTDMTNIYQRITMILTIVMVFYITFEFVKYSVTPDTFTDKEKGAPQIVKRIIIAILLIAFVPTIFSFGYKIQNKLIKTQVFSKVILGQEVVEYDRIGRNFSGDVFSTFYRVDYDTCQQKNTCEKSEKNVETVISTFKNTGSIAGETAALFGQIQPGVEFDGLLAVIFGGFVLYILFLYCMDVGVRYAQLLFLQIIAPIAIISSIAPQKDNMLKKWSKQCITTYVDLFIRLAIIYFMILIISILGDALKLGEMTRNGDRPGLLVYLFMVAGLLIFAQKAPKMIKELFPGGGGAASIGFGFNSKDRTEPLMKSLKTAAQPLVTANKVVGNVAAVVAGAGIAKKAGLGLRGMFKAGRAAYSSAKNTKGLDGLFYKRIQKGRAAGEKYYQNTREILANTKPESQITNEQERIKDERRRIREAERSSEFYEARVKEMDRKLKLYDIPKGSLDAIGGKIDDFKAVKAIKLQWDMAKNSDDPADVARAKTLEAQYKAATATIRTALYESNGEITQDMLNNGINYTYKEIGDDGMPRLDANGQEITHEVTYKFEDGDKSFSGTVFKIEENELAKFAEIKTDISMPDDPPGTPRLGEIMVTIKRENGNTEEVRLADVTDKEYIANVHKIKDAMDTPKYEYEQSKDFVNTNAYAKWNK